ncbi:MAG: glycerophosphodiester phosphodiesterase family protein [Anaerolineales bacterium]|jgi:glycerophosphoryl diester phosphodiesterase
MYSKLPRPSIIAHRGSSSYAPENTLTAFEIAIQQNSDAIELDAKLSKDGHVVIIHDATLDRTTNGTGLVREKTLKALKELNAGSFFDETFNQERIPTLEDVLINFGEKIVINIELTNYNRPTDKLPEKVVELVIKHDLVKSVIISSFNPIALRRCHQLLPDLPIGLLSYKGHTRFWTLWPIYKLVPHQAFHLPINDANPSIINKINQQKAKVFVYTVNQPIMMRQLFEWGVDGIFTDDPPLAIRTLIDHQKNNNL